VKREASFFNGGLWFEIWASTFMKVEPMSRGPDSVRPLMASLLCIKMLVKYGANLVSDFDPQDSCFGE
jgi:hypothetical protein